MIIKSICLRNFQSYYGEETFEFSDGLNIIIGNGGKGKSKLFNAFYWVLFGKIYITGGMWCETRKLPQSAKGKMGKWEFINKRALYKAKIGETITASVELNILDDKGHSYSIFRSVDAYRNDCEQWDSNGAWNVEPDAIKIVSYDDNPLGTEVFNDYFAETYISNLFPKSIRDYIWFQGESLDQLIDFNDNETFTNVMKNISYLPYYDKLLSILDGAYDKIEKAERRKTNEVNANNRESNRLNKLRDDLLNKINISKSKIEEFKSNIEQISLKLAEDNLKLEGHIDYSELVRKYNDCKHDIEIALNKVSEKNEYQRTKLSELWILRGIEPMLDQAKQIIKDYTEEENTLPEKKYLDNPSRAKLEEILHDGKCFVCGADCSEGTPQHNWIIHRMQEQEQYLKEMEEYTNNMQFAKKFTMFVGKIKDYPDSLKSYISMIDSQYQQSEEDMTKARNIYRKKQEDKEELEKKRDAIKQKYHIDIIKEVDSMKTTRTRIKASTSNLEKQKGYLESEKNNIFKLNQSLQTVKEQIQELEKNGDYQSVPQTEWKNITSYLKVVCEKVYKKERVLLREKLSDKANDLYKMFTSHDNGYRGVISIDENYKISFEAGLNTSHEDRKKMCYINALLALSREEIDINYPFISDAPTSTFDQESTFMYLLGIKDVFGQTIIMTKDVEVGSEHYTALLNDRKVTKIYELSSLIHEEVEGELEMHQVSTTCKPLKK